MILTMDRNTLKVGAFSRHHSRGNSNSSKPTVPKASSIRSIARSPPRNDDVLLGRGHSLWPGNLRYREIICKYLPVYAAAKTNKQKTQITLEIVAHIRSGGGRFLKEDRRHQGLEMVEMTDENVRLRVGQALRHQLRISQNDEKKSRGVDEHENMVVQSSSARQQQRAAASRRRSSSDAIGDMLGDCSSSVSSCDSLLFPEDQLSGDTVLGLNNEGSSSAPIQAASVLSSMMTAQVTSGPQGQVQRQESEDASSIIDDDLIQEIDLVDGDFNTLEVSSLNQPYPGFVSSNSNMMVPETVASFSNEAATRRSATWKADTTQNQDEQHPSSSGAKDRQGSNSIHSLLQSSHSNAFLSSMLADGDEALQQQQHDELEAHVNTTTRASPVLSGALLHRQPQDEQPTQDDQQNATVTEINEQDGDNINMASV